MRTFAIKAGLGSYYGPFNHVQDAREFADKLPTEIQRIGIKIIALYTPDSDVWAPFRDRSLPKARLLW